jgi:arylsulfatase A-like enzyme
MNIVVLVVDRLHAGFLGCYGNAWLATPHFNQLASESFIFDQAFVDHPGLGELCRSWWTGTHYIERQSAGGEWPTLAKRFGQAGYSTTCLTDEPVVTQHPLTADFDEVIPIGTAAEGDRPPEMAESIEQTELSHFFATAAQLLDEPREPFFLWLHSRGLGAAWDAPDEFRRQYADEDEAEPPSLIEPPCRYLTDDDDPDELWRLAQAYAGQVTLVDECLGGLLEMLDAEQLAGDTAVVVLGARGFPLGRNRRLGGIDQALYSELLQTPLLMRLPSGLGAMGRSQSLVQTGDIAATLLELAGLPGERAISGRSLLPIIRDDVQSVRDRICLAGASGERGFRTPAWYLRLPGSRPERDEPPPPELYAKPDDRWETNDVAPRCTEVVTGMQAAHEAAAQGLAAGQCSEWPSLNEVLVSDLR